jgi:hypothetical protein
VRSRRANLRVTCSFASEQHDSGWTVPRREHMAAKKKTKKPAAKKKTTKKKGGKK